MVVSVVPFVPTFVFGAVFLLGPGLVVALFTNSDAAGAAVVCVTALAALVRPHGSWVLSSVLIGLRTWAFIAAAVIAVALRLSGASAAEWLRILPPLLAGGIAQLRVHFLLKTDQLEL